MMMIILCSISVVDLEGQMGDSGPADNWHAMWAYFYHSNMVWVWIDRPLSATCLRRTGSTHSYISLCQKRRRL